MNQTSWEETQELVTALHERSPADRERFVREHCPDPILCETLTALVKPPAGPFERTAAPGPREALDVPVGSRVGPYIILSRLGKGGMGEVFLGRDPRLDRRVALKCLLASSEGREDLRDRIVREARAAARITHSHVAAVHDVLEHEGRAFIVMEYVEGDSLAALIKEHALPAARTIAIGRQLAAALAAAHAGGVIHRDLKPANVQVMPDGSVKILDFGIAMALGTVATTTTAGFGAPIEPLGFQAGTPAYMSPEQLLGRTIDERSDLFSLSVILFEMATGRRPFLSGDPLDVLVESLKKLPRADHVNPAVPEPLADVIARGLSAYPQDRFQSAVEMGLALDAVREELTAPRDGLSNVPQQSPIARRLAAIVGAVAAAPVVLWGLGRITSAAYNATLERTGPFAWEPAQAYVVWGARSVVAPCVYAALAIAFVWTAAFVLRLLSLSAPGAGTIERVQRRFRTISGTLGLDDPIVLAQGLATIGVAALCLVTLRFADLIRAWASTIATADPERLWPLGPANEGEKVLYRAVLTILFLAFTAGVLRVVHLRRRHATRAGTAGLAAVVAMAAVFLLLNEVPYRVLFKNQAMLVTYNGTRCYAIGEDPQRWLLYCPDTRPYRNVIVPRGDPSVRPSSVMESIFTPPAETKSGATKPGDTNQ
jgi:serine/threonine-protein kinase